MSNQQTKANCQCTKKSPTTQYSHYVLLGMPRPLSALASTHFALQTVYTNFQLLWCTSLYLHHFYYSQCRNTRETGKPRFTWKTPLKLKSELASFCRRRFKGPSVNGLNCCAINGFLPEFLPKRMKCSNIIDNRTHLSDASQTQKYR